MSRRDPEHRERERGAVIVEMALIGTVFVTLAMGILEFGLAWRADLTVENAMRAGARVGSNLADDRLADFGALDAVEAAMADIPIAKIDKVIVYEANASDGQVPNACLTTPAPGGVSSGGVFCNVYTSAQIEALTPADFTDPNCSGEPDAHWCPTTRETSQSAGTDYFGIWISVQHDYVTNYFGTSGLTLKDSTVMRVEPSTS